MTLITLVSTWMLALALAVGQADAQPLVRFAMLIRAAVAQHQGAHPHTSPMTTPPSGLNPSTPRPTAAAPATKGA